ncbi:hypothetical protein [Legionella sp. WA2024007413]
MYSYRMGFFKPVIKYIQDKKLNKEQGKVLEKLFAFIKNHEMHIPTIRNTPSEVSSQGSEEVIKISSEEEKKAQVSDTQTEASITIQRIWRTYLLTKEFYSAEGTKAYWKMLDRQDPTLVDSESNLLAKMMYGKTIAAVKNDSNFPVTQHPDWPTERYYHRDDKLQGKAIDDIIKIFVTEIDYKKNVYVPIILVNNASIDDLLTNYLAPEHLPFIKIHKKEGENIGIVQIDLRKRDEILSKIQSAGLIASPWELAKLHTKYLSKEEEPPEEVSMNLESIEEESPEGVSPKEEEIDTSTMARLLTTMPNTIKDLKESDIMLGLFRMAIKKNNPNRLLASCLHRMISALPETEIDSEAVQRIALFLSFGTKFYTYNYERFSFSVYAITHEISLLLNKALENDISVVEYSNFKKSIEKNVISSFALNYEPDKSYRMIAAPAMAGTHAFMVAMDLAKKMKLPEGKKPVIKTIGSKYFEFNKFLPTKEENETDEIADIYHVSTGPIVNPDGIHAGIDLNLFIRNQLMKGKQDLEKPISIVVDVTTGLHKNLKLDEDIKKLVNNGTLSIICYESYQKFGLAHTDQVQGGVVYGVCGDGSFSPEIIDEFEQKAKDDLENHLDMVIASFMHEHSGYYLEKIKEQHFENGALFRNFFANLDNYKQKEIYYKDMLNDLNELYFFVIADSPKLKKAASSNFPNRDSFGHFGSTLSTVSSVDRLSPNASDKVDTLIQISQLYLSSRFTRDELFMFTTSFLNKKNGQPFNKQEQVIFAGLLIALKNLSMNKPPLTKAEEFEISYGSHYLSKSAQFISGRNSYQALLERVKYTSKPEVKETNFIDQERVNKFLGSNPKHQDAMSVLDELKKLSKVENKGASEQNKHKAIIALQLAFLWHEQNPATKEPVKKFNFSSNKLICEAIVALSNCDILSRNVVWSLLRGTKNSKRLAEEIVTLHHNKSLNSESLNNMMNGALAQKGEPSGSPYLPKAVPDGSIKSTTNAKKIIDTLRRDDASTEHGPSPTK